MITRFSPFHAAGTDFKSVPAALLYIAIKPSLSGKVAAKPSKEVESPTVLPFRGILRKFAQDDIFYCHVECKRSPLGRSPPLRRAARASSPVEAGKHTPGRAVFTRRKKFYPKLKKIQKKLENRNA